MGFISLSVCLSFSPSQSTFTKVCVIGYHPHHKRVRSFLFIREGSESRKPSCRSMFCCLYSLHLNMFGIFVHLTSDFLWVFFQLQRTSEGFWDHTDGKSMLLFVRCCVCDLPAAVFMGKVAVGWMHKDQNWQIQHKKLAELPPCLNALNILNYKHVFFS